MIKKASVILLSFILFSFIGIQVKAQDAKTEKGPHVVGPVTPHVFDGDLRDLPKAKAKAWEPGDPVREVPLLGTGSGGPKEESQDQVPVVQDTLDSSLIPLPDENFAGIGINGVLPPDTNGDVGPNHYIQTVNTQFAVFNKSGVLLVGPININSLWLGFGGVCETQNRGDPIALYDPMADRWLISQFAGSPLRNQCIAISRGPNPVTDGWHLYDFPTGGFSNDYPKFGVWPDAYYMGSQRGYPCCGGDAFAYDRAQMLNGNPATSVHFQNSNPGTMMLPSDLDGSTLPPAGAPNVFAKLVDGAEFGGADRLELFEFHVDFATPANSTFTQLPNLNTAAFDRNLCGFGLINLCVPQPVTAQRLETLSAWLMYRLQYRNRGGDPDACGQSYSGCRGGPARHSLV